MAPGSFQPDPAVISRSSIQTQKVVGGRGRGAMVMEKKAGEGEECGEWVASKKV